MSARARCSGSSAATAPARPPTMRIVLGVLAADAGEVRWAAQPLDARRRRRRIGYMPEERGLYPKMKVGEQLHYLARLHGLSAGAARRRPPGTGPSGSASTPGWATRCRSCRWATSSGCSWPRRLCTIPRCWCSTSRSPASTRSAVDVMSGVLREQGRRAASRSCSPATSSTSSSGSATASASSATGADGGRRHRSTELRGRDPGIVIDVPGPARGLGRRAAGVVAVVESDAGRTRLRARHGVDDQAVLRAALADRSGARVRRCRPTADRAVPATSSTPDPEDA